METDRHNVLLGIILIASGAGLYFGWKVFWFLTDDAFIAFRYVSNSILGYGYTWNPPPFRPVEGYTSFLWVVVLDFIWRTFRMQPPQVANFLSLGFSFGSLLLTALMVLRIRLRESLDRWRLLLLALVMLGILTNRTFLAWTSSGLETALFNFCFMLWITVTVFGDRRSHFRLWGVTGSAALVYLSRPDGILVMLSSVIVSAIAVGVAWKQRRLRISTLAAMSPLIVVPVHLIWRRLTYGEWLPNTYYAKQVAAWPEAGVRYLASFILEYALWVWLLVGVAVMIGSLRKGSADGRSVSAGVRLREFIRRIGTEWDGLIGSVIVTLTVLVHVGYYTLIVGGDHFEYRVYSYLVPLVFVTFVWFLNRLALRPSGAAVILGAFVFLSLPIRWTHWQYTHNLNDRDQTHVLRIPLANKVPGAVRWYAGLFDDLQFWLIKHHVCMRHHEHKVFYEYMDSWYPERQMYDRSEIGAYPVMARAMVGVAGWSFPQFVIIDCGGLNDYVIARNPVRPDLERVMAHDRFPPEGYLRLFYPNVELDGPKKIAFRNREKELTAETIIANETYWVKKIVSGLDGDREETDNPAEVETEETRQRHTDGS